ncbi:sRNA-binding protein [Rhodovulum iodosum]|uniref:SRNA-binding protein n=1 Tax=Rhodovulum iodosum TaxID=68291 RepID=A0ABV3XRI4_9RHOB|nr:DUF2934 domain-containing protein [Rhodovulum robiginosum]
MTQATPTEDQIRTAAYYLWLEEGRPEGKADDHWARARAQLSAGTTPGNARQSAKPKAAAKAKAATKPKTPAKADSAPKTPRRKAAAKPKAAEQTAAPRRRRTKTPPADA